MEFVIVTLIGLAIGVAAGYFYHRNVADKKVKSAEARAEDIVAKAEARSKDIGVWLIAHGLNKWPSRMPPDIELTHLGGNRFRLTVP